MSAIPASRAAEIGSDAVKLGLIYWICVFIFSSILFGLLGVDPWESARGKIEHYASCSLVIAALGFALYFAHRAMARLSSCHTLAVLGVLSFVFSFAAAPLWALIGYEIAKLCNAPQPVPFNATDFGYDMVYGAAIFFGWSCLFISKLFDHDIREHERRLAAAREEALTAQMRALRYQVNPHFLFNTLNSVAALVEEQQNGRAQAMVLQLSSFLRTTLTLDPLEDVTLADELALQEGYLAIERERFSDRMALTIDLSDDARQALVPSLILQPVIENAIKHGVGRHAGPVEVALTARREQGWLRLTLENDVPPPEAEGVCPDTGSTGIGVGLTNVAERLRARFHKEGLVSWGLIRPGRFRVSLDIPWKAA
jgi:two-component system, LytTR family, sensor kinase